MDLKDLRENENLLSVVKPKGHIVRETQPRATLIASICTVLQNPINCFKEKVLIFLFHQEGKFAITHSNES